MEIEHDGEGSINDLPEELDADKLKATVDGLLEDNDKDKVILYLIVFQNQTPDGWSTLAELLEKDERLQWKKSDAD